MTRSTPATPASRLRGTLNHSHYISDDDNASETEAGDVDVDESLAIRVELIDLDGDSSPDLIDLTGDDLAGRRDTSPNLSIDLTQHKQVVSARTPLGGTISPGDCVECTHESNDAFLRIVNITQMHGEIYLHGDLLQRTGDVDEKFPRAGGPFPLRALMPRTKNELCALLRGPVGSTNSLGDALATRRIDDVGVLRNVIFTNKQHKDLNGQTLDEYFVEWKQKHEEGTLFCRRKYIEEMGVVKKQVVSYQIRWIDRAECDPGCGIPAEQIFDSHRPTTEKTESPPKRKRHDIIYLCSDEDDLPVKKDYGGPNARRTSKQIDGFRRTTETVEFIGENGQMESFTFETSERRACPRSGRPRKKYIYADLCAGAGGTTTGAKMAGMQIRYLLDFDSDACKTLKLNFGGVAVLEMDIGAFSKNDTSGRTGGDHIDVMHVSFPCQGHSMANRGINDELDHERIATAYGTLENILKKCKPRVLTLEQVPGILYKKDGQHFRAQVGALTEAGYDLRWKVINFALHGNSQARKRVIVIAACPGQILPPFPKATHGPGLRRPFVTVADVLAEVPRNPPRNDPMAYSLSRDPRKCLPWNANLPLKCCITGDGGAGNWHPSGKRTFSYQEKSQLQGFPALHKYFSTTKQSLGKQIGNAVPPVFAKALFEAIIPCLEEMDEKMRRWRLEIDRRRADAAANPLVID